MEIQRKVAEQAVIVAVIGSVDALTSPELSGEFSAQIAANQVKIVLDLSQVDFMSSAGLRALLNGLKDTRQASGDLRLAAAKPGVTKVLKMSGFNTIIKTYESVAEALASFA